MKLKKIAFGLLLLSLLACSTVTNMIVPPTATLTPTATVTLTASPTVTATATPLVPAYIPPECASQPLATLSPETFLAPTAEVRDNLEVSREEQLDILEQVDDIVRNVYVYPDFNGRDWKEIESRYQTKIEDGLDTEHFYFEMESMVEELGDEHSFFLSPPDAEEAEEELKGEGSFVGIGVYSNPQPESGRLVVISTFPGSSAERAGIKPHDSILKVDGYPVIDDHFNRLRGPACSALVVTVQSPGEAPRDILMVRHSMTSNLRIDARLVPSADGSKIGYIFIPTFFDETIPAQIQQSLEDFGRLDGLILDLRMNGGGSSTVANPILSFFTDGRLGQFVSRDEFESAARQGPSRQQLADRSPGGDGQQGYCQLWRDLCRHHARFTGGQNYRRDQPGQRGSPAWLYLRGWLPIVDRLRSLLSRPLR